jgi:D-beta-D-heptose 7-phosphate kinase/D-beta-D-heptose 1-phosphate adenosyltransferase
MPAPGRAKIKGRRALARLLERERRKGRRIVFTNGCFDLLHVGHLRSLEQARGLGDLLVVGVNRDRRVRELKRSGRPLVPERQRAEMIAGLACVDYVVLFGEDTAAPLIRALQPHVVAKGSEYRGTSPPEESVIRELGGRFVYLRQVPGIRSTRLAAQLDRIDRGV